MRQAIAAAAATRPHPNPRVGAVVVDCDGRVAASAVHRGAGLPHAEAEALAAAGSRARGGTLVVTLEPCSHHGRTPPCTEAVLVAGVARVVVANVDPDPRVSGRGLERLRRAGVEVTVGVEARAAAAMDPGYFVHRRLGRPRVTVKVAMTLDGQVAAADGTSQWITSPAAREDAHRLRAGVDAVMVGAGTLLADDPRLTVRLDGFDGPSPLPVVVAGSRPLPTRRRLWDTPALVLAPAPIDVPAEVLVVPGPDGVDLPKALAVLGERGILELLVEGGPSLTGALAAEDLIDRGVFYYGARLAAGSGRAPFGGHFATLAHARAVGELRATRVGPDLRVEFELAPAAGEVD